MRPANELLHPVIIVKNYRVYKLLGWMVCLQRG